MKDESKSAVLAARPARLTDMVAYQPGSVVSRTIISRKAGTLTLFAFDAGQELTEHTSPYDATICLLDGEAEITVSGRPFRVKEGEAVILPANEPHALKAVESFKMMLIMIRV